MFDASILSAVNVATVDSFKLFKVFFAVTLSDDFVMIDSCPVDMIYPENSDKGIKKIQSLLSDFSMLYRNYADYNDVLVNQNYGVGVVPSTAECIASKDNVGIYTVNQY